MASTSTGKQPLLIDAPLCRVVRLDQTSSPAGSADPGTGSNGVLVVDCTGNDGALIEEVAIIQRVAGNTAKGNLYFSTSNLALGVTTTGGQANSWFLARFGFASGPDPGERESLVLPRILAPVPHAGANDADGYPPVHRGLRIEKGLALWAAIENASPVANAPNLLVMGGFY